MNFSLEDKVILMTGGLGAIAEWILKALSAAGATLIVTDLQQEPEARSLLGSWGLSEVAYYSLDVTDADQVDSIVEQIFHRFPQVNVALGHAGGTGIFPFATCERQRFDQLVVFNFLAQTYFARSVLKQWSYRQTQGHLIFTSSYTAQVPMKGISAYVASKAALEMFAKNLALEYAEAGIRVNCISPGNVAAGSSKKLYDSDEEYRLWVDRVSPLGRPNSPQAVAHAFLFLCSSWAQEIDGISLRVDAGVGLPKLG